MKQKIVISVSTNRAKYRKKAMNIAAAANGVIKVGLVGENKDKLSIEGEDVDITELTQNLRKKLCYANVETVEEIKPEEPKEEIEEEEEEKHECQISYYCPPRCEFVPMFPVYDYYPSRSSCTIL